jgi:DNA-binding CsgD family transcriptional regulator
MIVRVLARIQHRAIQGRQTRIPAISGPRDFARTAVPRPGHSTSLKAWINGGLGTQNWPICASHAGRARGIRAIELFPEHRPGVVQTVSVPPGSRSDLRGPYTIEVRDERSDPLWRRRDNPFLRLLAVGRTNREIACGLFISEKTASVHVSNLMRRLGVANRYAAAVIAGQLGLQRQADQPGPDQ